MKKILSVFALVLLNISVLSAQTNGAADFANKMRYASWTSEDGVMYPNFMSRREVFVEDLPASCMQYKSGQVELCYFDYIGSWAGFDSSYPAVDVYVSPTSKVKNITYRSRTGVYSGYTQDGRIFYMKVCLYPDNGDNAPGVASLILIYPRSYENAVQSLISEVQKWHL